MNQQRRTSVPLSSWTKGFLAFVLLIATGVVVSLTVTEQSTYVSVEDAVSGKFKEGDSLQIHGTVTDLKVDNCILADGNFSIKVDMSNLILPDTFAENKGATFTGILHMEGDELVLRAEKVQMGCPSKYEPAEE